MVKKGEIVSAPVSAPIMNVGVIVNKGFEKVAVRQIREILEDVKEVHVEDTIVIFKPNSWEDTYRFIYQNQIANRVIGLIDEFDYTTEDELLSSMNSRIHNEVLKDLITKGIDGFRVSVKVHEHMDVTYLESEIGGVVIDYAKSLGQDLKVNLKNPTLNLYIYIFNNEKNNTAYIGIDLSDDLSKRDYKIFNNAVSLKGPTAFGLLMLADYKPQESYLNPFCYSGTVEIEAALYATKTSHRFYNKSFPFIKISNLLNDTDDNYWESFFKKLDSERTDYKTIKLISDKKPTSIKSKSASSKSSKLDKSGKSSSGMSASGKSAAGKFHIVGSDKLLSSITAAVKNAKIAGVESFINFRRVDIDWMDIKYEERELDKIITFIPGSSKHDKTLPKEFKQFFYHAEYIIKKSGWVVVMCLSKDLLIEASKEHFELEQEVKIHSGNQEMFVLYFKRKKK